MKLRVAFVIALVLAVAAVPALAERSQTGNVIVSLRGRLSPKKLPRDRPAPVAVYLAGGVATSINPRCPGSTRSSSRSPGVESSKPRGSPFVRKRG